MKLTIGENIRTLRRAKDMTQEQLADKLGVTYQSVSRWENAQVYPDIELLPAIAEIFEISTDALLGVPEAEKTKRADELIEEFCRATYEEPDNKEKIVSLLREIRLGYIGIGRHWDVWLTANIPVLFSPKVLPETRLYFEAAMEKNPNDFTALEQMICWEDEEHLEEILSRYSTNRDLSREALLRKRYTWREEHDKADPFRQAELFSHISALMKFSAWHDSRKESSPDAYLRINTLQLELLNAFCNKAPTEEHPVSADGKVDSGVESRLWLGFRRACCLAALGKPEEAFKVLEDTVSLLEETMKITDKIVLEISPITPDIVWTASEDWHEPNNHPTKEEQRMIMILWERNDISTCYCVYPSSHLNTLLTGEWSDSICNDPRYQSYVDRVKALIVTRPRTIK